MGTFVILFKYSFLKVIKLNEPSYKVDRIHNTSLMNVQLREGLRKTMA